MKVEKRSRSPLFGTRSSGSEERADRTSASDERTADEILAQTISRA